MRGQRGFFSYHMHTQIDNIRFLFRVLRTYLMIFPGNHSLVLIDQAFTIRFTLANLHSCGSMLCLVERQKRSANF